MADLNKAVRKAMAAQMIDAIPVFIAALSEVAETGKKGSERVAAAKAGLDLLLRSSEVEMATEEGNELLARLEAAAKLAGIQTAVPEIFKKG